MKNFKKYFSHVIVLLVIFSMILPNYSLAKRQKRGAQIIVTKNDGSMVEGELLIVKDYSLLLMTSSGVRGEEVDVGEIQNIKIKKKSNFITGAVIGYCAATLFAFRSLNNNSDFDGNADIFYAPVYGLPGLLVGGLLGSAFKSDESIVIRNRSELEVTRLIQYLKKKARFKN